MEHKAIREEICETGRMLWQLGYTASNDGNISVKLDSDRILITPTGVSKGKLKPEMLVIVNGKGEIINAPDNYAPTTELMMHIRIYSDRPDVKAVVHAHPPISTGFAVAHVPLDKYTMPEAIVSIGIVPLADFGAPFTDETPESIAKKLPAHDAILIANHGVVTLGDRLSVAYYRMETVEQFAKVSLVARLLGGEVELTDEQLERCYKAREILQVPGHFEKRSHTKR